LANKTSQHILTTSANLLGFCLFIISSLHIGDKTKNSFIDEFTSIIALLLAISSVLSFFSIRTQNTDKEHRLENIADKFFIASLFGIFAIIVFIIITYWNK
jgi:magnesium-transporting ATPase (P-type)